MNPARLFALLGVVAIALWAAPAGAECEKTAEEGRWVNLDESGAIPKIMIEHVCKSLPSEDSPETLPYGPEWFITVHEKSLWFFPPRTLGKIGGVSAGAGEGGRFIFTVYRGGDQTKYVYAKMAEGKEDLLEVKIYYQTEEWGEVQKPKRMLFERKK